MEPKSAAGIEVRDGPVTVTLLFSDIEGSTRRWENQPVAMKEALERHDRILLDVIARCRGEVFKTVGDAFFASFQSAIDAVEAADLAQRAISSEPWGEIDPIRIRLVVHTGEVHHRDGDFFGPPLNRAARMLSASHGGQTLLSEAAAALVQGRLTDGLTLLDCGEHRLKDLVRPERLFQLCLPGLRSDFPPLRTLSVLPNNLPPQLTSFVGREHEMVEIDAALDRSRLVTLIGSGGTGKTRLAIQVAANRLEAFEAGAWFVDLAPVPPESSVLREVANVLNIKEGTGGDLFRAAADQVKDSRLLILLDNCEHLIEQVAALVSRLLRETQVRILATSREPLKVAGETVYRVPSLAVPPSGAKTDLAKASTYVSVQLFADRAASAVPSFQLSERNAAAVASVCTRLDGIPLAIELAAARTRSISVDQIAERLDDRFRLLTGGSRDALPRQQTLRALVDWSYELLSLEEGTLLNRLSVFSGGWRLPAAEQVAGWGTIEPWQVLDLLSSLVDKSLVTFDVYSERYGLLETVRQYALEKLVEAGEMSSARTRHLLYFENFASEAGPGTGPLQGAWMEAVTADRENLHAAIRFGLAGNRAEALRLVASLQNYWDLKGLLSEGREILEAAVAISAVSDDSSLESVLLNQLSSIMWRQGDSAGAERVGRRAAEICEENGDLVGLSRALGQVGNALWYQGKREESRPYYEESLEVGRRSGNLDLIARGLNNLGLVAVADGDDESADKMYREALALREKQGDHRGQATLKLNLAEIVDRRGNAGEAVELIEQALGLFRELDNKLGVAHALHSLGEMALVAGKAGEAAPRLLESFRLRSECGEMWGVAVTLESLSKLAYARGQATEAALVWQKAQAIRGEIGAMRSQAEDPEAAKLERELMAKLGEKAWAEAAERASRLNDERLEELVLSLSLERSPGSGALL